MGTKLTIEPDDTVPERSTLKVSADFSDEDGDPITPKSAAWSLTDAGGNVVNSRADVPFTPLGVSVFCVLSGADTALQNADDSGHRVITIEAVYDSDLGLDLPLNDEATFEIRRLVAVT